MLKQEGKTQYRFYRPRRPGGMYGEGLKLEGVSAYFGIIGILLLMLVGAAMLLISGTPSLEEMEPVAIELTAPPYKSTKARNTVLLPITKARVMALDPAAFAAADTGALYQCTKGTVLQAWLEKEEARKWKEGVARKDFYKALLLERTDGKWLISYNNFRSKSRIFNNQGWWLILLGCILLPYQFLQQPRIKAPLALGLYLLAVLLFALLA